ncbi:hypothetical protein LCGC14_0208250 [marine sediment metagenome]|uniref:Uncharacterized protein n=1 Tax=marine sediment metagenome TaxID=412755 RepID=A0A0F9UL17_9ZZZZ
MKVEPRLVFEILFTKGDWRMVRATAPDSGPKYGKWVVIQHRCGGDISRFSEEEWSFCLYYDRVCGQCETSEPDEIVGFHNLYMWNNEEDLP